jgi:hypothetical protein
MRGSGVGRPLTVPVKIVFVTGGALSTPAAQVNCPSCPYPHGTCSPFSKMINVEDTERPLAVRTQHQVDCNDDRHEQRQPETTWR